MIGYLQGKIIYQTLNWIILNVNGVGYKIYLKINNSKLKIDKQCELYIYHHIREDRSELYGFNTPEELHFFELLISVSGVGPKMAQVILSQYKIEKLHEIISNSDSTLLTTTPGVGKKLAMKIILELKSKLKSGEITSMGDFDQSFDEVLNAMETLGYKKTEISTYLSQIPTEQKTTEQKIKWLLKNIKK